MALPDDTPDDDVIAFAGRLFDLARRGDAALLDYLDAGAPVNLTNSDGDSLLMLAAYNDHAPLVEGLITRGADVDQPNDQNHTPLAGVTFKGFDRVALLLLRAGADPTAGSPNAIAMASMFERTALLARYSESAPPSDPDPSPDPGLD
ncbi:MAG: ankyrin repeat domain-containing protein [Euzebya sp.]